MKIWFCVGSQISCEQNAVAIVIHIRGCVQLSCDQCLSVLQSLAGRRSHDDVQTQEQQRIPLLHAGRK